MNLTRQSVLTASALLIGGFIGASALVALADSSDGTWKSAPGAPANANTPAPVNVGTIPQVRSGLLGLGNLMVNSLQILTATGTTTMTKGSVLSAIDSNGNVGWVATSSLGISGGSTVVTGSVRGGCYATNAQGTFVGGNVYAGWGGATGGRASCSCPSGYTATTESTVGNGIVDGDISNISNWASSGITGILCVK